MTQQLADGLPYMPHPSGTSEESGASSICGDLRATGISGTPRASGAPHAYDTRHTPDAPYAIVMGITGNWAFTAGTLLQALRRHNPHLRADYLLYADANLAPQDAQILQQLGAKILPLPAHTEGMGQRLTEAARRVFSTMSLIKFDCLSLLGHYEKVLWLDSDILVQDSIEKIFDFGALSMAVEDASFTDPPSVQRAGINALTPLDDLDAAADNYNSGVILFDRSLPQPQRIQEQCIDYINNYGGQLRYPDQAIFNIVLQQLRRQGHKADTLPQEYNMHPRNPKAPYAPLVHAFGAYKVWNDGFTAVCFPEWQRDYARWQQLGGTPHKGTIDNADYLQGGAFQLVCGLYDTLNKADQAITTLHKQLAAEKDARTRLETLLRRG